MKNLAMGYTLRQIADRPDEQEMKALQRRMVNLKGHLGAKTTPHLVYRVFAEYYLWPFQSKTPRQRPLDSELEAVQLIAEGHSTETAGLELHLSGAAIRRRLTKARRTTRANTLSHLVAICWSKEYIV